MYYSLECQKTTILRFIKTQLTPHHNTYVTFWSDFPKTVVFRKTVVLFELSDLFSPRLRNAKQEISCMRPKVHGPNLEIAQTVHTVPSH